MPPRFRRNAELEIASKLTRGEDETTDLEGFRIICKRLRCARLDRLFAVVPLPVTQPIRSISTSVSLTRRPVVPTVVRAGGTLKYSFHTSSKPLKFWRSVRKTCALKTLSSELPAASKVF